MVTVNNQRFAHHKNKEFYWWDMINCVLPRISSSSSSIGGGGGGSGGGEMVVHNNGKDGTTPSRPFDLVHVRDVIQHMNLDQGVKYFCNIFQSGPPKILITTSFFNAKKNHNITQEGGFYLNNLEIEPFAFPKNDNCIRTHPKVKELDYTCVYDLTVGDWVETFISKKC